MKKLPITLLAVLCCWISAMALIPWHTSTTIDGTTYRGTFYFDAPAYVEVDSIGWDEQKISFEMPDSISFNGTTFKVVICRNYLIDSTIPDSRIAYKPLHMDYAGHIPDSISFLYFPNVYIPKVFLKSIYFKDSMDYISVMAAKVYNYSAPILEETYATDTLTLSDNVQILKVFNAKLNTTRPDMWYYVRKSYRSRLVDFKNINTIKTGAIFVNATGHLADSLKYIEFSGSKVDSVEIGAIDTNIGTSLRRLDLHDSPAFLNKECFSFRDSRLDYFRCGADSFSSSAFCYNKIFPVDTVVLTKAKRIHLEDLTTEKMIIAPKVDVLVANSIVKSKCNPKRWLMNVKTIKRNAFGDDSEYTEEEQFSLIDTLQFRALQTIESKAFYGSGIRMNCLVVTDKVESIGDSILMFGPKEVIVTNGNKNFYTEDGEWLFSKDNPEKPILHYGVAPNGDSYTPKSKYYGYNVDISHVKRVDIGPDFIPTGWGFYNTSTNTVSIYINKKGQECRDAMNLFKGNDIEFYVPEDVYLQLMAEHGYPPGYPTNFHPFDFSAINTTHSDSVKVSVVDGKLTVTGADSSESLEIYTTDGRLVYKGSQSIIPTVSSGVYIVRCAGTTSKVAL